MKFPVVFNSLLLFVFSLTSSADGGAVSLDMSNYVSEMSGKNAFVKFLAPWWGHCKSMKPAWDSLGDEYAGSSSVVIADVDCTVEGGKELCAQYEVRGYPTIKYFVDGDTKGKDYEGGRDMVSLKKFAEEELASKCNALDPVDCSEKERKYIHKQKLQSELDRQKQLARLIKMMDSSMKPELKAWINQRISILTTLTDWKDDSGAEL